MHDSHTCDGSESPRMPSTPFELKTNQHDDCTHKTQIHWTVRDTKPIPTGLALLAQEPTATFTTARQSIVQDQQGHSQILPDNSVNGQNKSDQPLFHSEHTGMHQDSPCKNHGTDNTSCEKFDVSAHELMQDVFSQQSLPTPTVADTHTTTMLLQKPRVVTLGCRLNGAESDMMQAWAAQGGPPNTIIVNTCAVTTAAERQARQTIRQLRRDNPDAFIMATGCAVQLRAKKFASMPEIDRLIGNNKKHDPSRFRASTSDHPVPRVDVGPIGTQVVADMPVVPLYGRAKAFVQVQNGCNHFCTFCTIPLARGRSRSVPATAIVSYIQQLIDQGAQEIVLTGVDLTSYQDPAGGSLADLVTKILHEVPALMRLRLSSVDSMEIDEALAEALTTNPRIMPHLHLSLQAGSNPILAAMKRRHTREQAIQLCHSLKKARPEMTFGADFITGFPGEDELMFAETMDLVHACQLTYLHVFPFSPRPGTPAARMSNPVPSAIVKDRAAQLRARGHEALMAHCAGQIGRTVTLLTEKNNRGHADDFAMVHLRQQMPADRIVQARLVQADPSGFLVGDVVEC